MYPIEDYGLIKIDLLSQRSLGVLRDTLNVINAGSEENKFQSAKIFRLNDRKSRE
jgi:DNA polymerase III alpha subunit